ncbi:ABC transporter permease [Peptoniphilus equinus]|uniref:ABC transporter permease n=1 Tax=Peptoniphilus equinus TaxID=3016343 RepID=A0ABY7QUK2_9FIRM|nr:ABC transporter permease [Peptoniphilus equinus]WBW50467.1 ABC transporter permease [Peptoniphilus equinus]
MNLSAIFTKLIAVEFKKSRHKHSFLLIVIALVLNYFYLFHGNPPDQQAWYHTFYAMPLINTLILSILMAVLASQSVDMEHRGLMWNLLSTLEDRASIYLGKLLYGFIHLSWFCLLQMVMVILMGIKLGYDGNIPFSVIGSTFLAELVSGMIVYQLQCLLSLFFPSQFAALSIGFGGTLAGFFLAYVSTTAWTPWSVLLSLSPIGMDYQRSSRTVTLFLHQITLSEILTALLYLVSIFLLGLYIFTKTEKRELNISACRDKASRSVHSGLPVELIKLKRNPIWIPFLLIPLISAVIGTFNFTQNQDVLQNTWADLWTQQSLFLGIFFLAPLVGILCSLLWRMEHQGSNWNLILTVAPPAKLVRDKYLTAVIFSSTSILWIALIYLCTGKIILRLPGAVPGLFWFRMISAAFCLAAITAVQSMLSMIFRSFAVPIALAFVGSFAGLWLTLKGAYYAIPYSMLIYGMGSSSITGAVNVPVLLASCCFYILGSIICSIVFLKRSDVRTHV